MYQFFAIVGQLAHSLGCFVILRRAQSSEQLEQLLERVEAAPGAYRSKIRASWHAFIRICAAQLAAMRSRGRDPETIRYLNALCVRAYTRLQVEPIQRRRLPDFFFADFPKVLAATAWLQLIVAVIMIGGAVAGASIVSENPAALYGCIPAAFYPSAQLETLMESHEARADFLKHRSEEFGVKSIFSAALFTHNLSIGILSFAVWGPGGNTDADTRLLQRPDARRFCVAVLARFALADVLGVDAAACDSGTARHHTLLDGGPDAGKGSISARTPLGARSFDGGRTPCTRDGRGIGAAIYRGGIHREFRASVDVVDAGALRRGWNRSSLDRQLRGVCHLAVS